MPAVAPRRYNRGGILPLLWSISPARAGAVLTQRLDLKLLFPILVVCLILVGACLFGALYLSHLHVNVAEDMRENFQSTQAAIVLETTIRQVIEERQGPRTASLEADMEIGLGRARYFANHEREKNLVDGITEGWRQYQERKANKDDPAQLADVLRVQVLEPCVKLRDYNLEQIQQSDRDNQRIVDTLRWGMLIVGVGGSLSGLVMGYGMARRLSRSIAQLSVRVRDAAGRLNRDLGSVTVQRQGDLGDLDRQMGHVLDEIGRTVDQLQQREHEVLRAEQLAAVGQLAAGVAHELRNPLTSIKILVQTGLEGEPPSGLPAEDLAVVEQEVRRMEDYIRTFLDFARPPRSERRRTDLGAVVRRAVTLTEGRARRQRVTLSEQLPAEPVVLDIDPEQVQQVLVNLLLNAVEALPAGGSVTVAVERPAGGPVTVSVRDDGPGIAGDVRERLFQPFVTGKADGVGLGLSICKRLVEAHGGGISAGDAPGGGTVVRFTLPTAERAAGIVPLG
jgi:two-component system sensor histidine kinase HydH